MIWVTDEIEFGPKLKNVAFHNDVNAGDDYDAMIEYKSANQCSFKLLGTITPEMCIEECRKGIAYSSTSQIFKNCSFSDDDITACQYTKQENDCSVYSYNILQFEEQLGIGKGWFRKGKIMLA